MKYLAIAGLALLAAAAVFSLTGGGASADDETVEVQDNSFSPADVTINVGDTVTWNWTGDNPHTVTAEDGTFDSPQQTSGSFEFTFDTAGTFDYQCEVHGTAMSGTVTVQAAAQETPVASPTVAAGASPTAVSPAPTAAATTAPPVTAPSTGSGGGSGGLDTSWLTIGLAAAGAVMLAGAAAGYARRR